MDTRAAIKKFSRNHLILLVGDLIALGAVALAGFARHDILEAVSGRIWATFIPWAVSWVLVAPLLGAFDRVRLGVFKELWRPMWAVVLATPLAATLRAIWLNAPVQWTFVVVLAGVGAFGIGLWRLLYFLWAGRSRVGGEHG